MDLDEFLERVSNVTPSQLHEVACALRNTHSSSAGELAWWRVTIDIDRVLRRGGLSRRAGMAAVAAASGVSDAARRAGIPEADTETTAVARAAAVVARGIVAGREARSEVDWLLLPWAAVIQRPRPLRNGGRRPGAA